MVSIERVFAPLHKRLFSFDSISEVSGRFNYLKVLDHIENTIHDCTKSQILEELKYYLDKVSELRLKDVDYSKIFLRKGLGSDLIELQYGDAYVVQNETDPTINQEIIEELTAYEFFLKEKIQLFTGKVDKKEASIKTFDFKNIDNLPPIYDSLVQKRFICDTTLTYFKTVFTKKSPPPKQINWIGGEASLVFFISELKSAGLISFLYHEKVKILKACFLVGGKTVPDNICKKTLKNSKIISQLKGIIATGHK